MKIKIDIKSVFGNVLFSFEKENNTIKNNIADTIDCKNIFFIMAYKSNLSNLRKHTTLSVCPFSLVRQKPP